MPSFRLKAASGDPRGTALSRDGRWLADGGDLWEVATGRLVRTDLPGTRFCGEDHVVGEAEHEVVSLQLSTSSRATIPRREGDLLSPDGCQLARSDDRTLRFFDTRTGREVDARPLEPARLSATEVDRLFHVDLDGLDREEAWSWGSLRRVDRLQLVSRSVNDLTASADERFVCHRSFGGAREVDLDTGKIVFDHRTTGVAGTFSSGFAVPKVSFCELSPDGGLVAVGAIRPGGFQGMAASDYGITVFGPGGRSVAKLERSGVYGLRFTEDGRSLRVVTRPGSGPDRCERFELASKSSSSCDEELGVRLTVDNRGVHESRGEQPAFAITADPRVIPALPSAPAGPATLAVTKGTSSSDIVELPSRRWRATVPTDGDVRWMSGQAVVFQERDGLVAYRLDDCSVLRVAGLRVGGQKTFVAATDDALEADALARMLFREQAPPRRRAVSMIAHFLTP